MDYQDADHIKQKADTTHDENIAWLINDWNFLDRTSYDQWTAQTFDVYESLNGL